MQRLLGITILGLAVLPAIAPAQRTETARLTALLSSSKETGTVNGPGGLANATVEFILKMNAAGTLTSAKVDFRIQFDLGQAETLVAMHIHEAREGVGGPVVIGSTFGDALSAGQGSGTLFRSAEVTDADRLGEIEDILENPGNYYVNIHSQSNPGGIMRGQLEPDALKATGEKIDGVTGMIRKLGQVLGLRL